MRPWAVPTAARIAAKRVGALFLLDSMKLLDKNTGPTYGFEMRVAAWDPFFNICCRFNML